MTIAFYERVADSVAAIKRDTQAMLENPIRLADGSPAIDPQQLTQHLAALDALHDMAQIRKQEAAVEAKSLPHVELDENGRISGLLWQRIPAGAEPEEKPAAFPLRWLRKAAKRLGLLRA